MATPQSGEVNPVIPGRGGAPPLRSEGRRDIIVGGGDSPPPSIKFCGTASMYLEYNLLVYPGVVVAV